MEEFSKSVGVAVVAGALLRVARLWQRPLWMDEALQAWISDGDVFARAVGHDLHPLLLSGITHAMLQVSDAEVWLRLPSFVASLGAIAFLGFAARDRGGDEVGLIGAWAAALCPPWVLYAGELRPYSLAVLGVCALLWALPRSPAWQVGAGVFCVLTSWSGALVAALLLAVARQWVALGVVVVVTGGQALLLADQLGAASVGGWMEPWLGPSLTSPLQLLGWLWTGHQPWWLGIPVAGLLLLPRDRRDVQELALVPLVVFWGLSWAGLHPLGGIRHALVLSPALLLLAAIGLPRVGGAPLVGLACLLGASRISLPVQEIPAVVQALDVRDEPVYVDASAVMAWRFYGGREGAEGRWNDRSVPPRTEPIWVVSAGPEPDVAGEVLESIEAQGARARLVR